MKVDIRCCKSSIEFSGFDVEKWRNCFYEVIFRPSSFKRLVFNKLLEDCKILEIRGYGFLNVEMPEDNFRIFSMIGDLDLRGKKKLKENLLEFAKGKINKKELIEILTPYLLANKFGRKKNVV